jgi:hypothetical protein
MMEEGGAPPSGARPASALAGPVGGARIAPKPYIGYLRSMINNVPTFGSTMMMPLSIREAGPFGM